jgi:hypothetical protein
MVDLGEPVHETREKAADMSEIPAKWLRASFPTRESDLSDNLLTWHA